MKRRRFLRKALRPRMFLIYILIILIVVLVLTYALGGIKAKADGISENLPFNFESGDWKSMLGAEDNTEHPELSDYNKNKWIAQNDKFVMYFDESTTIATVYVIEPDALTGANVQYECGDGSVKTYPEVDVTKCKVYYTSAQTGDKGNHTNLTVRVADSSTGKFYSNGYSSYSNSVQYYNKFTQATESHFYLNYNVEDGLQILYEVGEFNAGENYLAQYVTATLYKPEEDAYIDRSSGEVDEGKYNAAMEKWVKYMSLLGVEDAANAPYKTWLNALYDTLDERFRGNTIFYTTKDATTKELNYTGSIDVYTKEAYEYFLGLVNDGIVEAKDGFEIEYSESPSVDNYTYNCRWNFKNISPEWLDNCQEYFNTNESPLTHNFFLSNKVFEFLTASAYTISTNDQNEELGDFRFYPYYIRSKNMRGVTLKYSYNLLYTASDESIGLYKEKDGNLVGGYVARNEDGTFVGEGANIERKFYSLEQAAIDNERFNHTSATSLPIVQVGLQLKLTEDGLKASILKNSLVDTQNAKSSNVIVVKNETQEQRIADLNQLYVIYNAEVLPYMAYVDNTGDEAAINPQKGSIIVPDGSGAIINFDNGKTDMGATAVNKPYYGRDEAFISKAVLEETQDLMLGMYGFIKDKDDYHEGGAILGIVEKGGNQVSLFAQTKAKISSANFIAVLRLYEEVAIGAYTNKAKFNKWAAILTNSDLEFMYIFLDADKANYSDIAAAYREYLIKRDNIEAHDTTNETVVNLNFLGAFEKYALFLGFKYKTPDTLTTFDQAGNIVEELSTGITVDGVNKKVNAFSVSYTGWTTEELQYQVGGSLKVSPKLGGKKGMQKFASELEAKGISFYPEVYITTTQGYDLAYGNLKYTARSISNEIAVKYQFDVSTQRQNKKIAHTNIINPSYYNSITDLMIKNYDKLDLGNNSGAFLVDLGNMSVGSYNKSSQIIYGQDSIVLQLQSLAKMKENGLVKVKAPYDYAFKYIDIATDIPLTSTKLAIYDETIPFYQLVISGLFDYTTEEINGTSNYGASWYGAKALESGANLNFQISATNPTVLLDTDYTYYYQAFYDNWKEAIVNTTKMIDDSGIHKGVLTNHELLDKDISHVTYTLKDNSGTIEIYVNATSKDYTYIDELNNTYTIPAYGYIKVN